MVSQAPSILHRGRRREQHYQRLVQIAGQRAVTPCTMARIIVEIAIGSPEWLNLLVDDYWEERRDQAGRTA